MAIVKISETGTQTVTDNINNIDRELKGLDAQRDTTEQLKLLNARIEEAFDTRINEKDIT